MRGVFDDEEIEPARSSRDTELTLGWGALIAIVGGLVLLCAAFFGIGYAVGTSSAAPKQAKQPQAAIDQEPLQASGNIPKPSAVAQVPVPQSAPPEVANGSVALGDAAPPSANGPAVSAPTGPAVPPEVHPALTVVGNSQNVANSAAEAVRPALSQPQAVTQGQQFMVQIAAVSNAEDADVLVNALKKRSYPVISKREPADNFIHVRIGPFASRQIADQWKMKLLNDGYNAQVQP